MSSSSGHRREKRALLGVYSQDQGFFGCTPDVDLQPCLQLLGEASSTTRIFFVALVAYYNQQHLKGHLRTT